MMEYCEGRKECGDGKAYAEDMRELEAFKEEWDGIFSLYDALHGCGEAEDEEVDGGVG